MHRAEADEPSLVERSDEPVCSRDAVRGVTDAKTNGAVDPGLHHHRLKACHRAVAEAILGLRLRKGTLGDDVWGA
jgi:hypothetical protein